MVKRNLIRPPVLAVLVFVLAGQAGAQSVFVEVHGKVEILPPGASEWTAAALGMAVETKALISVGFNSGALIQTGHSRIQLRPLTRLSLEEVTLSQGSERIDLALRAGRIRADVSPPEEVSTEFTVRSPMTVASVRGTSFEFDTVNLVVDSGLVRFSYINGLTVYVARQEASRAEDEARRVIPPQELAEASRIPKIPLYTGIEEMPAAPRYPMGGTGLTIVPSWIP
jgi:ferric-dicitrate binding protein FerR (iron transport regulator)